MLSRVVLLAWFESRATTLLVSFQEGDRDYQLIKYILFCSYQNKKILWLAGEDHGSPLYFHEMLGVRVTSLLFSIICMDYNYNCPLYCITRYVSQEIMSNQENFLEIILYWFGSQKPLCFFFLPVFARQIKNTKKY